MDKLKNIIEKHSRFAPLEEYVIRIDANVDVDFSSAIENCKCLMESIAKEICKHKSEPLTGNENINQLIKKAFSSIGYSGDDIETQFSTSLANIANRMGALRNAVSASSHGRTMDELRERNAGINDITKKYLIDSTELVACFLIQTFENENSITVAHAQQRLEYAQNTEFNDFWDDEFGEFEMGEYSFPASEILYSVDYSAYEYETKNHGSDKAKEQAI